MGENEIVIEFKTSEVVVVPEVEATLPTARPRASVALDYVILNEKNNKNEYITSFCQQKEILKTLDSMVCRSKAVKQLMNVNGLKKEITEVISCKLRFFCYQKTRTNYFSHILLLLHWWMHPDLWCIGPIGTLFVTSR